MKVIVIGAGVVGASVAFRLAQGGAQVRVLEMNRIGGGTSGRSFAWTNANNKPPRPYHDLNVAGMRAHAALRAEFGETPWWHGGGSIEWEAAPDRAAQREKVERLQGWGYAAEWITRADLAALEPDLDLASVGDAPVAYYPEEGWLDPVPYAHAMLSAARRSGAVVESGAAVARLVLQGGRVTGVELRDGTRHSADLVVNCAGRWLNEVELEGRQSVPLAPTAGLLVFTPPVATTLRRILRTPLCDLRPDGAGRLMIIREATGDAPSDPRDPGPDSPEARDLAERARRLLPCIGPVLPEATRVGIRPMPRDGFSAVGVLPGVEGYYVAVTHSGVTLSPFLGIAVSDEILNGRERPELADFRPGRFEN